MCRSGTVQQDAKGSDCVEPPVDKPKKWLEFAKASGSWPGHFWPVLFVCTFFGPKVNSSRAGTPLESLRQSSELDLNDLLRGIGGTSMRPSLQSYRRTKVRNILPAWKKKLALAFEPRPLLSYNAEIAAEKSPVLGRQTPRSQLLRRRASPALTFSFGFVAQSFEAAFVHVFSWSP